MFTTKRETAVSGVAANSTAVLDLPVGLTYHGLNLVLSGLANGLADVTKVALFANGREIIALSGIEIDLLNRYHKQPAYSANVADTSGILNVNFERAGMINLSSRIATAITTGPAKLSNGNSFRANDIITQLRLEVTFAADAGATVAMDVYSQLSGGQFASNPILMHQRVFNHTLSGAGPFEISDFPKNNISLGLIHQIVLEPSAGVVSDVTIERNGYKLFERTAALNTLAQQKDNLRDPSVLGNRFMVDSAESGIGSQVLNVFEANDFRLLGNATAGGALKVRVVYYGPLGS